MNTELIQHITKVFQEKFGSAPEHIARAPGRVNLLGEHVDYNEGVVLPAAIDRASYVAFSRTDADQTNLTAVDFDQEAFFPLKPFCQKRKRTALPYLNGHSILPASCGR